jgi:hypothetical protein
MLVGHVPIADMERHVSAVNIGVVVQGERDLAKIILALSATSGFPRLLHGGQQQRNQNRDNRDHHQQFNDREATTATTSEMGAWH